MRVERVVLEHHRDVALARRKIVDDLSADADLAVADLLEPGDHAQRRRLAAAGGTDEHDELAFADLEVQVVDRNDPVVVDLREVHELDRQPRTAPAVRPKAIRRCTSKKKMTTGTAVKVAPAISGPHSVPRFVVNDASHTVRVCFSGLLSNT